MGLFSPKNRSTLSSPAPASRNSVSKGVSNENGTHENVSKRLKEDKGALETPSDDQDTDDIEVEKKQYAKEKAPPKEAVADAIAEVGPETETLLNTKLNAMLYHTSEDSIDLYRSENNSLDLLGRLYYDDYDPDNRQVVERVTSFTSLRPLTRTPVSTGLSNSSKDQLSEKQKKPLFSRQVSFDTLSDSHHLAITLKVKHPEFKFRRNNKTFLIGFSNDSESMKAVAWAFLEMVISGDTIIVFQVLDEKSHNVVDPQLAELVLEKLQKLNTHSKRISLVYEVVIGNPQKLLKKAILEYKPAMMIVGTKQYGLAPTTDSSGALSPYPLPQSPGLSQPQPVRSNSYFASHLQQPTHSHHSPLHRSFFSKSSTSKYFLQYALVPVIIVKPFYNIQETLEKPVNSENYFRDWLANIDISHTREKKKKHMFGMRSNLSSRNLSHTSLTDFFHHERNHEKNHEKVHDKLSEILQPHESRGRSGGDRFSFSVGGSRDSSPLRSRSRSSLSRERRGDTGGDSAPDGGSRSRSRSRLSRMFSG